MRLLISLAMLLVLSACSGISRDNAKALGTAGVSAMQAIHDQTYQAQQDIAYLPEMAVVNKVLGCVDIDPKKMDGQTNLRQHCIEHAKEDPKYSQEIDRLSVLLQKRILVSNAFLKLYQSYVDLATYDAGAEFKANLSSLCDDVDDLAKSAAVINPAISAVPLACSTVTTTLGAVGGALASLNQEDQLQKASVPMRMAVSKFSEALVIEKNAIDALLDYLVQEKAYSYQQFLAVGLIDPEDPLTPLLAEVAPNAKFKSGISSDKADIITAAAKRAAEAQAKRDKTKVILTYEAALSALKALAEQHTKLEAKQPLDLSTVLAKAEAIKALLAASKAPPATAQ